MYHKKNKDKGSGLQMLWFLELFCLSVNKIYIKKHQKGHTKVHTT